MIEVLQTIVQKVNRARNLDAVLTIIVTEVKQAMKVDVSSVYLTDFESREHVLMLTDGLTVSDMSTVRLKEGEGLVGLVAQRAESVNIANALEDPRYAPVAGTGVEDCRAFLGVPIIYQRKVLGVLVVQCCRQSAFSEEDVAFLVTLAAQLAGAIAHAEARGGGNSIHKIQSATTEKFISGVPGAPGVGIGTAVVLSQEADFSMVADKPVEDVDAEIFRYQDALGSVVKDIDDMKAHLGKQLDEESGVLFDAYAMLINSDTIVDHVIDKIKEGNWAQGSLREVIEETVQKFEAMEDPYLRERSADIKDIGKRILLKLLDRDRKPGKYPKNTVLVGEALSATDLAQVPIKNLVALVSTTGSSSSHVAILARAMGKPAIMGVEDLDLASCADLELIVDGYQGRLYLQASTAVTHEYARLATEESELSKQLKTLRKLPAETTDGKKMPLFVNTGLMADMTPSRKSGADGIGLYRTEFPFMIRDSFPGEEEQRQIYRQVLKSFAPRQVTLRTLDIGGDKALPYFPIQEENPFLGWRGIRITLDHHDIFLTQIRAMLRAAVGLDNLQILLPMISDLSELDEALRLIHQAFEEMETDDEEVSWPKIGVMIEVPSAVYQADILAQRVDFLSIGTNDLTQYLLAVDRNNSRVAKLYDGMHPSVLKAINQVVEAGHKYGRPVGVCGELAGDPAAALLLMGMGVDNLSMAVASLPRIKWVIRSFSQHDARIMLTRSLETHSPIEIRKFVNAALESAGLGGLLRAGK